MFEALECAANGFASSKSKMNSVFCLVVISIVLFCVIFILLLFFCNVLFSVILCDYGYMTSMTSDNFECGFYG